MLISEPWLKYSLAYYRCPLNICSVNNVPTSLPLEQFLNLGTIDTLR